MLTVKFQPVRTHAQLCRAVRCLVSWLRKAGWGSEAISSALVQVANEIFH